jgi:hypothetical protein
MGRVGLLARPETRALARVGPPWKLNGLFNWQVPLLFRIFCGSTWVQSLVDFDTSRTIPLPNKMSRVEIKTPTYSTECTGDWPE